jgi:hypothetical protein
MVGSPEATPGRPRGRALLSFSGEKTTFLEQTLLPHNETVLEKSLG